MLPDLHSVSRLRRQLGLTQSGLARAAGVSQSLVAKVESGKLDPSYSKARALLDALDSIGRKSERRAADVMQRQVDSVSDSDSVQAAVSLLRRKGFSQLPVLDSQGRLVGSVSESGLLALFERNPDFDAASARVSQVLEEPFPTVSPDTPVSAVTGLLHSAPAVLVVGAGKVAGIVTKADLLRGI